MQLKPLQLAQHVQQQLLPIYLIHGDDILLRQEAVNSIRLAAAQQGCNERVCFDVNAQFAWSQLDAQQTLSLFSSRRLIELNVGTGKIGDAGSKAIQDFCKHPTEDCLIVIAEQLDAASKRSKWVKAITDCGGTVPIYPLTGASLQQWLQQRAKQCDVRLNRDALTMLMRLSDGNLLSAAQCLEKLALAHGTNNITAEMVEAATSDSARYDIFQLVNTALLRDANNACRMLVSCNHAGEAAALVLWAFLRQIRQLIIFAEGLANKREFNELCAKHAVWDKQKPGLQAALAQRKPPFFYDLLRQAKLIDDAIKGIRQNDPWLELQQLTIRLAAAS